MHAELSVLYESPAVRLLDFRCREHPKASSRREYNARFEISFTRSGSFQYRTSRRIFEIDHQVLLLTEPGTEYSIAHGLEVRDTCSVFQLNREILEDAREACWRKESFSKFSLDRNSNTFPVTALSATPALEHLHMLLLNRLRSPDWIRLNVDLLVIRFVEEVFREISGFSGEDISPNEKWKRLYLETMERTKEYILDHFQDEFSLSDLSHNVYVSEFHLSRLFKQFTHRSLYQYLIDVRLKHAALLLRDTKLTVTEICFESGWRSLPHFIHTFNRRFGVSPKKYRTSVNLPRK